MSLMGGTWASYLFRNRMLVTGEFNALLVKTDGGMMQVSIIGN